MERGTFTEEQRNALLTPISEWRVMEKDGQSHLAAFDVIAHLNRVFGFEGWDKTILSLDLVYEHVGDREVDEWETVNGRRQKSGRKKKVFAVSVGYRCTLRLTVRDASGNVVREIEDAAMGTATNQRDIGDAHDLAVKSAVSYALKRCAKDLGDQFGLSLYNKGSRNAVVGRVLPYGHEDQHTIEVQADGIDEGDSGMGFKREGDAPAEGEHNPAEDNVPPVREPEPAKPAAPEPTPPAEKPAVPVLSEEQEKSYVERIVACTTVPEVKALWKDEVAEAGHLDALVLDLKSETKMTLRELMVRRVTEIETQGAA